MHDIRINCKRVYDVGINFNEEASKLIEIKNNLTGISNRYHDLAILYRSIKYNFNGSYGKSYEGFLENKLFDLLKIKRNDELIKYFLVLDEILG